MAKTKSLVAVVALSVSCVIAQQALLQAQQPSVENLNNEGVEPCACGGSQWLRNPTATAIEAVVQEDRRTPNDTSWDRKGLRSVVVGAGVREFLGC